MVAQLYIDGIGVEQDPITAKRFLEMSAYQGDPGAAMMIYELYQGKLKNDLEKQKYWLNRASKLSGESIDSLKIMDSFLVGQLKADGQLSKVLNSINYAKGVNSYGTGSHILGHNCLSKHNMGCRIVLQHFSSAGLKSKNE